MKRTISIVLFVVLLFSAVLTSVSAYVTPFDVPDPATAGDANAKGQIRFSKREGGTYLYCNNPEQLHNDDLEKALMIEHDVQGKVFFTNENKCEVKNGLYLGLQLRNHSGSEIRVTVHNIGYQVGGDVLGQQEWTDFFQTELVPEKSSDWQYSFKETKKPTPFTETTYTIPDGEYIYVMGGTSADAYQNINVADTANKKASNGNVTNGVVFFTVDGPETGVDAAFVCYSSAESPVTTDEQQGYLLNRGGTDYSRQYLGSAPFLCVDASVAWNINDSFTDGRKLPVTYETTYYGNASSFGAYEAYTNPKTNVVNATAWYTNLNPESDKMFVGEDMMPFYCVDAATGEKVVVDVAHNDGVAKPANIGNWMTVYEESLTFRNSGKKARTFTFNMECKGMVAINVRDKNGALLESIYHSVSGPVYTYTVPAGETATIVVEYVLLANSYGKIIQSVTVGTPEDPTLYGDPTGDGSINAFDYMMTKTYVLGTYTNATDEQKKAMDVNRDSRIDAFDYMMIKSHVLGSYVIPQG